MILTDTELPGVKLIEPVTFEDERGLFYESFNLERFRMKSGCRPSISCKIITLYQRRVC